MKNLIGQVFGNRTVLEKVQPPAGLSNQNTSYWLVECSCGEKSIVRNGNLQRTSTCKRCVSISKRGLEGECSFNGLYLRYKHGAAERHIGFGLTKEEFRLLTKMNCNYCNQPPKQIHKVRTAFGGYTYSGVDRVDSNVGYFTQNCVPCCEVCNRAKNEMPLEDFEQWIARLVSYRTGNGR